MKKISIYILLSVLTFQLACSPNDEDKIAKNPEANFKVYEKIKKNSSLLSITKEAIEVCHLSALISNQNSRVGEVIVERDGDDLIVYYITENGWAIDATHLSIGNCEEENIPVNSEGNPTIGQFEHYSSHSTGVNWVAYVFDIAILDNNYCFAAQAEVSRASINDTAWADGEYFTGVSGAMYVNALISDCPEQEETPGGGL